MRIVWQANLIDRYDFLMQQDLPDWLLRLSYFTRPTWLAIMIILSSKAYCNISALALQLFD
jgi:hypothetical protein